MKNTRITTFLYKLGFFISFMLFNFTLLSATEEVIYNLKFKQLSAPHSLPTNEVQKVYQDRDGFGSLLVMDYANIMDMKRRFINPIFILRIY